VCEFSLGQEKTEKRGRGKEVRNLSDYFPLVETSGEKRKEGDVLGDTLDPGGGEGGKKGKKGRFAVRSPRPQTGDHHRKPP